MKVALLTVGDRAAQGVYEDKSGPAMQSLLSSFSEEKGVVSACGYCGYSCGAR